MPSLALTDFSIEQEAQVGGFICIVGRPLKSSPPFSVQMPLKPQSSMRGGTRQYLPYISGRYVTHLAAYSSAVFYKGGCMLLFNQCACILLCSFRDLVMTVCSFFLIQKQIHIPRVSISKVIKYLLKIYFSF